MALQPSLNPCLIVGDLSAPHAHTLEAFWDYCCPYSGKSANAIENIVKPILQSKYPNKVKIIFRLHPQPWHASSTFMHEAGLAVAKVAPDAFWKYSLALFKAQEEYYDVPTANLTPKQIRDRLAELGQTSGTLTAEQVAAVKDALTLKGEGNSGLVITNDLKACIKYSRQNSIHVSPTILWDGLIANDVSSSWGEAEWSKFLESRVAV